MGKTLIDIKQNTLNDQVRTCLPELLDARDASVLEKWYYRTCLRLAQRTIRKESYSDTQLIWSICDEKLLISIQTTLTGDVTLSMAEINEEYLSRLPYRVRKIQNTPSEKPYILTTAKCSVPKNGH